MKKFIQLFFATGIILLIMGCPKDEDVNPEPELATFDVYTNPTDPQLFTAHHPDGTEVTYLGEKDRDGNVISIDAYTVLYPGETEPYLVTVNDEGIPSEVYANNGCVFKFEWISTTKVIVTAITPTGSYEVRTTVDFAETGLKTLDNSEFKNIRSGKPINIEAVPISPSNNNVTNDTKSGNFVVSVEKCGVNITKAFVTIRIDPWDGNVMYVPPNNLVDGLYSIPAPVIDDPIDYNNLCNSAVSILDFGCATIQNIDPTAGCVMLGSAIDFLTIPSGEAVLITAACKGSWTALQAYCKTLGQSASDVSIASYICDKIITKIHNPPSSVSYQVRAIVHIPGENAIDGGWKPYIPGSTPPSWEIEASGEKEIKNFITVPTNPAPYQSYTASAKIYCPEPTGTLVTIKVVGDDGYTATSTETLTVSKKVSIVVPGAAEGVNDIITITVQDGPTKVIGILF